MVLFGYTQWISKLEKNATTILQKQLLPLLQPTFNTCLRIKTTYPHFGYTP